MYEEDYTGIKAGLSVIFGVIGFIFFMVWLIGMDVNAYDWKFIKINLAPTNGLIEQVFTKCDDPKYYLLIKENGCGDCDADYIIIRDEEGREYKVMKPNKTFYNQSGYIKRTFKIGSDGIQKPENFNGYIQHDNKTYTLSEFYEHPPFDRIDPLAKHEDWAPTMGWIALGCLALIPLFWIPWSHIHLPKSRKITLEQPYAEIFGHLKMLLRVKYIDHIDLEIDEKDFDVYIKHDKNQIIIKYGRDGFGWDYDDKQFFYQDENDIKVAKWLLARSNHFMKLYNKVADIVLESFENNSISSCNVKIRI